MCVDLRLRSTQSRRDNPVVIMNIDKESMWERLVEFQHTMERVPNMKNNNIKSMQGCMVCECGHGYWHIRFTVTPCFPQSVKITILAKNYGKLKDVNV
jgi:hypothetical protein